MLSPYIIICAIFLSVGIVLAFNLWRRNKELSRTAIVIETLLALVVSPGVFFGIHYVIEAPEKQKEQEAVQAHRTDVQAKFDRIFVELGDKDVTEELIRLQAEKAFGTSHDIDELIESLPERLHEIEKLEKSTEETVRRFRIAWEPTYLAMVYEADTRMKELKTKGLVDHIEGEGIQPASLFAESWVDWRENQIVPGRSIFREMVLKNGVGIILAVLPGAVDLGTVVNAPQFEIYLRAQRLGRSESEVIFTIKFEWNQATYIAQNVSGHVSWSKLGRIDKDLMAKYITVLKEAVTLAVLEDHRREKLN